MYATAHISAVANTDATSPAVDEGYLKMNGRITATKLDTAP
ncbi:unnamed protein product, partial [marine sediment metagenome]